MTERIVIVGDGGWGTGIGVVLADNGRAPVLWGHDPDYLEEMRVTRRNSRFLPGAALPDALAFEPDLSAAVADADLVIAAVPVRFLRAVFAQDLPWKESACLLSLAKGIERDTLLRPSEILRELTGIDRVAVLSGPSHAEEVAGRRPTTVTAAAEDPALAERVQAVLMTPAFRVYTATDVVGVELGGALKNVIALAAGMAAGMDLGDNAMAALITRGLAEIRRLGVALGADPATFAGLSGVGDLVVTCISQHGRNRAVGMELGRGRALDAILAERRTEAEGVHTAASALALAERAGVEMPITAEVVRILREGKPPRRALADLMAREGKSE